MIKRNITRLIVRFALVCATLAWSGWSYLHTVADPHRVENVSKAVLASADARTEVAGPLADKVVDGLALDPALKATIVEAMTSVMADPRIADNITAAFGATHARSLGAADARPGVIDGAALLTAVRDRIVAVSPEIAAHIPQTGLGDVELPEVKLPYVGMLRRLAEQATLALALVALLGLAVAFGLCDRRIVLRRYGIWAISTGLMCMIGPYVVILAAHRWMKGADATIETAVLAATAALRHGAFVLSCSGVVALCARYLVRPDAAKQREEARTAAEAAGASAAAAAAAVVGRVTTQPIGVTSVDPLAATSMSLTPLFVHPEGDLWAITNPEPRYGTEPVYGPDFPRDWDISELTGEGGGPPPAP